MFFLKFSKFPRQNHNYRSFKISTLEDYFYSNYYCPIITSSDKSKRTISNARKWPKSGHVKHTCRCLSYNYLGENYLDNALELGGLEFKGVQVDKHRLHKYDSSNPNEVADEEERSPALEDKKEAATFAERGLGRRLARSSLPRRSEKDARFLSVERVTIRAACVHTLITTASDPFPLHLSTAREVPC